MDVQVEKTGSYLCKLSVSIPAGDVNQAFENAVRKFGKQAQIPGFRAGKIPRTIIERHYGPQITQEVQNQLVEDTLFRAMDDSQLSPVAMPRLSLGDLSRGANFSYTAEVEVRPEITLQKWEGLPAPVVEAVVPDADVDTEIESLRKQAAQTVPVLLRDVVQDGDIVLLDYEGFVDGEPFAGGKAENALVEVGGEGYIPGFAEGLVGAKVPGEREVPVTFPADYSAEQLAGKDAVFKMTLKELKSRELPALDDEFAKDMGADSLAALQQRVRGDLQSRKDDEAMGTRRTAVLKALVEANPFEVPPSMIASQTERIVSSAAARVERMVGQRIQFTQEQLSNLRADSQADAEFQVRSGLLLLEVAKAHKLEVPAEEMEKEIETQASSADINAERLRAYYDDPEHREELHFRLLEGKVVDLLLERSTPAAAAQTSENEAAPPPEA